MKDGEEIKILVTDTETQQGKQSYPEVNHLLYVDPDGYYKYDSHDFNAAFNKTTKTFALQSQVDYLNDHNILNGGKQWTEDDTGNARGFWPFGTEQFWAGMHMKADFSMPENGRVLNPNGVYKDMIFEFQGDDDTWLYIDGVLVGDAGGVHNQTLIRINFREGTVYVTGKEEHKAAYRTNYAVTLYLDQILPSTGSGWIQSPANNGHKTFAPNTYHTFDMFYLERGGGESNLHIKWLFRVLGPGATFGTYVSAAGV